MAYTIYPDTVNYHTTIVDQWSDLRDGDGTVVDSTTINGLSSRYGIADVGGYIFNRTYIQFDISGVTEPITSMQLYVRGGAVAFGNTTYVAYAGSKSPLTNSDSDYPRYLAEKSAGGGAELSTVIIPANQYVSCSIDITAYPIYGDDPSTPAYQYYNIALVADDDFLNNVNGTFLINTITNAPGMYPYLVINGGYANTVNGIPGANITTVSGVPIGNIANIMGA